MSKWYIGALAALSLSVGGAAEASIYVAQGSTSQGNPIAPFPLGAMGLGSSTPGNYTLSYELSKPADVEITFWGRFYCDYYIGDLVVDRVDFNVPLTFSGYGTRSVGSANFRIATYWDKDVTAANSYGQGPVILRTIYAIQSSDLRFTTPDGSPVDYKITVDYQSAVPELGTWALMIMGFGGVGAVMRRRQNMVSAA